MNASLDQAARLIEDERAQVANELHDGVLPLLFAASASLSGLIEHSGQTLSPEVRQRLEQTLGWIDDAMHAGRRLLNETYPPELKSVAWSVAAFDTVHRLLGDASKCVHWQVDSAVSHVSEPVAFAAYRIVVEAIRNAVGHGQATEVIVTGNQDDQGTHIVVSDNGSGFDLSMVPAGRFGVRSMIGRAELVGGELKIDSKVGGPTIVSFTAPRTT